MYPLILSNPFKNKYGNANTQQTLHELKNYNMNNTRLIIKYQFELKLSTIIKITTNYKSSSYFANRQCLTMY